MKARSHAASSSTSRKSTSTPRRISDAARWVDRVGIAALFPGSDLVLPSLWEAIAGTRDVDWAVRDETTGKYVSFTPEMNRCWGWKDELPERGLACVGKHLGRWAALIAPRVLAAVYVAAADRRDVLTDFQLEVADAVRTGGPCTGPELRALVGADKKQTDAAVIVLQRALVLTNSGLVEQEQGWGAIAVDVLTRKWKLGRLPRPDAAARTLAATVLASSGELSAADLGGALGWRLKRSRQTLDELVERGEASVRVEGELALYTS
jgi:Winged helix DNA-binding domain